MKKIHLLLFLAIIPFQGLLMGQEEDVLLTIDDHQITRQEFLRIYGKNQQNLQSGEPSDVEEYLDLFINFKLKVVEAQHKGLDTLPEIREELKKYKNELARPYLIDKETLNHLISEAYERSKREVKASHILISMPQPASYEDTLHVYEKIMGIRERIIKKGESFSSVARATSDDPSVKSNGGNLGFFTALQMVYPFENRAYNMDMNEVSKPFRTKFGYHLLKKTGERPARGRVKVAHIMLIAPESMPEEKRREKKERIDELYHQLKQGASFDELARKYSDDKSSAQQGGELPWFGVGRMVQAFQEAAFSLEEKGSYTKPVKTPIGWHIIKLIDRETLGTLEEEKKELRRKITNNPRYDITQDSLIKQLKKEYQFYSKPGQLQNLYQFIDREKNAIDWDSLKAYQDNDTLFTLKDSLYSISRFISYLDELPRDLKGKFKGQYLLDTAYSRFVDQKILEYEKKRLPNKHPEYKYIMKEYHDGILLFEIMDRRVWTKASEDTAGLRQFFANNRQNYMWPERFEGKIYLCENQKTLEKVRDMKKGGFFRKKHSDQEILDKLNTENHQRVEIKEGLFHKGENAMIDHYAWNKDIGPGLSDKRPFMVKGKTIPPRPKSLEDARGAVLADYQNHLEEQWIKELREKYRVRINEEVLREIKQNN